MDEFLKIYDSINRLGFPLFFIFGALRGWWYLKPHVDLLIERMQEMNRLCGNLETQSRTAMAIATESNALAQRAIEMAETNDRKLDEIQTALRILLDRRPS